MPTYHVENFGCRATQADGAAVERQFESRGLGWAASSKADFVILNTCTVTNSADQDARAAIRRVRRQNPAAKIIVTGCYAQRAPEEIAGLPGVSAVIGNSHKHRLAELALCKRGMSSVGVGESATDDGLMEMASSAGAGAVSSNTFLPLSSLRASEDEGIARRAKGEAWLYVSDIFAHTELLAAPVFESTSASREGARTRPNLKVQDGCDNRCSFCIIPSVRGQSRSLPESEIVREVNTLVAAGYKELVISGINLGRWGREAGFRKSGGGRANFESLLRAILRETSIEKLRISSVEPMDWSDSLIDLVAGSPRIAKHAHVPLQSGSDAVLRRMHRKYRPWHYREKIEKIHAAMPSAAIGADVMTGFPGESDAEFEATRRLIAELPFTYLHVFTYSARPGTRAAAMADQVPVHIARERNKVLRELAAEKKLAFMKSLIGAEMEAITLGVAQDGSSAGKEHGITEALTDNYQKLYLRGRYSPNQWIVAKVDGICDGALMGSLG